MKCLYTGANGFFARNTIPILRKEWEVKTLGRSNSDIQCDLSKSIPVLKEDFDVVIHAAGKAHVFANSEEEKQSFFDSNYIGTKNLIEALDHHLPKQFILISTVAVYGNDWGNAIAEDAPLGADTAYARSKLLAEELVVGWAKRRKIRALVLRLPLIVGHHPKGNLQRMAEGIKQGKYLRIGKGEARKSMVLAEDVGSLMLRTTAQTGTYNLTDGYHPSFRELDQVFGKMYGKRIWSVPKGLIKAMAWAMTPFTKLPFNMLTYQKMVNDLTFDDSLARKELQWQPNSVLHYLENNNLLES